MTHIQELDARKRPPESLRDSFKKYQKVTSQNLRLDTLLVDLSQGKPSSHRDLRHVRDIASEELQPAFTTFIGQAPASRSHHHHPGDQSRSLPVYEAVNLPGR